MRIRCGKWTIGSLFSGVLGLERGLLSTGMGPVLFHVEKDPFCQLIIRKHAPEVPLFDDVCSFHITGEVPRILCGGPPCQGHSSAGKGLGFKDPRSALWYEFRRIVEEARPPIVVVENVASGAKRWLPYVRRDLHVLGYRTRALPISAFDVGAPHLRRRIFVVAADPERVVLREQQRWLGGQDREGRSFPVLDGEEGNVEVGDHRDTNGSRPRTRRRQASLCLGRGEGSDPSPEWDGSDGLQGAVDGDSDGDRESVGSVDEEMARVHYLPGNAPSWSSLPEFRGVAHGIPNGLYRSRFGMTKKEVRVARLKCLGNAVVPDQAAVVGRFIQHEVLGFR